MTTCHTVNCACRICLVAAQQRSRIRRAMHSFVTSTQKSCAKHRILCKATCSQTSFFRSNRFSSQLPGEECEARCRWAHCPWGMGRRSMETTWPLPPPPASTASCPRTPHPGPHISYPRRDGEVECRADVRLQLESQRATAKVSQSAGCRGVHLLWGPSVHDCVDARGRRWRVSCAAFSFVLTRHCPSPLWPRTSETHFPRLLHAGLLLAERTLDWA